MNRVLDAVAFMRRSGLRHNSQNMAGSRPDLNAYSGFHAW
jgi:hypothetical protein